MVLSNSRHVLTQDELVKKVNVRRKIIVFLEKNRYNPSLKLAYDIARFFGVNIEEIFIFGTSDNKGGHND